MQLSLDKRFSNEIVVKAICKRLAAADSAQLPAEVGKIDDNKPRDYQEIKICTRKPSKPVLQDDLKPRLKLAVKKKVVPVTKQNAINIESEDSFDRGENPKRNLQTQTLVKSNTTGSYYLIILNYVEQGDKYLMTLKDTTKKQFLCKRQEMPRDFAIYEVPVEDLDDPTDVFQTLKQRLEHQIREEAHLIVQSDPDKIDRAFFQIKRRPSLNATSSTKTKENLKNQRQAMTTDQGMSSSLKRQPTLQEMRDRADKVIRQASINNQYDYSGAVED